MEYETTIKISKPPFDYHNEAQVLGSILVNEKLLGDISDTVKYDMFFDKFNQKVYSAMLYLYYNHVAIGYETLLERIKYKFKDQLTDDDLVNRLFSLSNAVASIQNFDNQVEHLIELYRKRELYNLYKRNLEQGVEGVASNNLVKEIQDRIENMGITSNIEVDKFEDYVDEWLKYMEDDSPIVSHKLGFKLLDDLVLLENSNLMIIGARPSVGKSAFATNLVKNFCLQGKKPLFISLEMNKKEYMNRLVSNMAHIPARKLKRKEAKSNQEWASILKAKEQIKKFKFNFYDKGGMKIEQLLGLCRFLKKKDELDILVIDYLQLLESNQYKGQKQNQVGYISQKLKQIAMELDIPVIALSQLSRGSIEKGVPREPVLSDLRDSGSLEQDANVVIMLHTEDVEQKFGEGDTRGRFIDLFVRKNRDGKLGQIKYEYFGDYVDFKEKVWDNNLRRFVEVPKEETETEIDYLEL